MTVEKLTALSVNTPPSPILLMSKPATAGPIRREALKVEEFKAMALGKSSRSSINSMKKL